MKDGFSAEKESAKCAETKKLQTGDLSYEENKAAAATRARLELDGISAEKSQIKAKVLHFFLLLYSTRNTLFLRTLTRQPCPSRDGNVIQVI